MRSGPEGPGGHAMYRDRVEQDGFLHVGEGKDFRLVAVRDQCLRRSVKAGRDATGEICFRGIFARDQRDAQASA